MSVLEISASYWVCDLYSQLRHLLKSIDYERKSGEYYGEAILISVSTSFSENGYLPDGNTLHKYGECKVSSFAHFVLCGNVHVWAYVGPEYDPFDVPLEEWTNPSNHDSCWRSDGVDTILSNLYFTSCDEVQAHLPEELKKAPMAVSQWNRAGGFLGDKLFNFVSIRFKSRDGNSYRYPLTSLKRLKKRLVLQEE